MNLNNSNRASHSRLQELTEQLDEERKHLAYQSRIDQQEAELTDARNYNLLACVTPEQEAKVWRMFNKAARELNARRRVR